MRQSVFRGCLPALMTPWTAHDGPNFDCMVHTAQTLLERGMSAVVYCGSMGEWPLLSLAQRQEGVARLIDAGAPVVVGTGAASPAEAAAHARHAKRAGAAGLMAIPRVLSRGTSPAAQLEHFAAVLEAADGLPTVIYNSPYYGFETRAETFFALKSRFDHLAGFKEFGGADSLSYAAERITSASDGRLDLLVGVDTEVVHGVVNCGASGWITGIGNALPDESLTLLRLANRAADGDALAHRLARELAVALDPLCRLDTGPDLVLYFRHLAALRGFDAYARPVWQGDRLSESQAGYASAQLRRFERWWAGWEGVDYDGVEGKV